MMDAHTFPSWEALADLTSGGLAAEYRAILFDSEHPEHIEKWEEVMGGVTYSGAVFKDAYLAVPFLIEAVLQGDPKSKEQAMAFLTLFAWDADFSKHRVDQAARNPLLVYDPEWMLVPIRKNFGRLESVVDHAISADYYSLGVLVGEVSVNDVRYLQKYPEIEYEYMMANLMCGGYQMEVVLKLYSEISVAEIKNLLQYGFMEWYESNQKSMEKIFEFINGYKEHKYKIGAFACILEGLLGEFMIEFIIKSYDAREIINKIPCDKLEFFKLLKRASIYASVHETLQKPVDRGVGVVFNDHGIVMDIYKEIKDQTGIQEFDIPHEKWTLSEEDWKYLFDDIRIQDSEDLMSFLGIYNTPEEIEAKLRAQNLM